MDLASLGLTNVGFDPRIIGEWNFYESYGAPYTGINNTRDIYTYTGDGRVFHEGASINGQPFNAKNELNAYWFTATSPAGENILFLSSDGQTWNHAPYQGGNSMLLAGKLYQKSRFLNIEYPYNSVVSDFMEKTFSSIPPNNESTSKDEDPTSLAELINTTKPADTKPEQYDGIIESVRGKGKLKGTNSEDAFTFKSFDVFGKKTADVIIGFDSLQGDYIAASPNAFPALQGTPEITFASTNRKKQLKLLSRKDYNFVYFEKKGRLYFDGNGTGKNWGSSKEGGLVAILQGKPELTVDDFTLLA